MDCGTFPFSRAEALKENYIVATYRVYGVTPESAFYRFADFAIGQTVGTWIKVPGITDEMVKDYQARVVGFELVSTDPEYIFLLKVAFPTVNFAGSFAGMLTGLLGNDVSTSLEVRLVDIELIGKAIKDMGYQKKTRSPIEKLRAITGVKERPIILNMIKPCLGFRPEAGAKFFREIALGGVDLVKDDELLTNPIYNEVARRVRYNNSVAKEVTEITGKETVYVPNITDRPSKMREHAKMAIDAGTKVCLINFVFTGFDAFSEICQEFEKDLFVIGHYAGVGVLEGERSGMGNPVSLGMLPRLAGADGVMTMSVDSKNEMARMDYYQTIQQQVQEIPGVEKMVKVIGGGITPLHIPEIMEDLGRDMIIGIGGAIQGHPMGATKGAIATMKAVEAANKGISLETVAKNCEPLKKALEIWG